MTWRKLKPKNDAEKARAAIKAALDAIASRDEKPKKEKKRVGNKGNAEDPNPDS